MSDIEQRGRADGGRCTEGRRETGRKALHVREEMEEGRKDMRREKRRRSRRRKGRRQLTSPGTLTRFRLGPVHSILLKESRVVLTYTVIEMHWKETTKENTKMEFTIYQ